MRHTHTINYPNGESFSIKHSHYFTDPHTYGDHAASNAPLNNPASSTVPSVVSPDDTTTAVVTPFVRPSKRAYDFDPALD